MSRNPCLVTVFLMIVSGLAITALVPSGTAQAPPEDYVSVTSVTDTSYYIGEKDVVFDVRVYNNQFFSLWNVTVKFDHAELRDGSKIASSQDPFEAWDTDDVFLKEHRQWRSEWYQGFTMTIEPKYHDLDFQMVFSITYDYDDGAFGGVYKVVTEMETVLATVSDGVSVGSSFRSLDENGNTKPLWTGVEFQKVQVYVSNNRGFETIGDVRVHIASIADPRLVLDNDVSSTVELCPFCGIWFNFRVTVDKDLPPGRYDAQVEITYLEYYDNGVDDDDTPVTADQLTVQFIVDYTPILAFVTGTNIATVTQGQASADFTIKLENQGNAKLRDITVTIDMQRYFAQSDFYYDENGVKQIPSPTQTLTGVIGVKEQLTADFQDVALVKYLPPGKHKLPIIYSGYYFDAGDAGGSTDWRYTDSNTYTAITGDTLYLEVTVGDPTFNIDVTGTASFDLGGRVRDVYASGTVRNLESVSLLFPVYTLDIMGRSQGGSGPSVQVFANPVQPGLGTLQPWNGPTLFGGGTQTATFNGDLASGVKEGTYLVRMNISGTNNDNGNPVLVGGDITVRINPEQPKLVVTTYTPIAVTAGKKFVLTVSVENQGPTTAKRVQASIANAGDALVGGSTGFSGDAGDSAGAVNPFSPDVGRVLMSDIPPGGNATASFTIFTDSNARSGKRYLQSVTVTSQDELGRGQAATYTISLKIKGAPEGRPLAFSDFAVAINGIIVLIVLLLVVLGITRGSILHWRPGGSGGSGFTGVSGPNIDRSGSEPYPGGPRSSPLPPAPPASAGPVPPPPPLAATALKVCPRCNATVPADSRSCPSCGMPFM